MECPNCSFQNAPGSPSCVRCESCLHFAGVDFIPPRAVGGLAGALRRDASRMRRDAARALAGLGAGLSRPWMGELSWPALAWSVVPGLGQIRYQQRVVGFIIMGAWVCLLLFAGLVIGSARSWLLASAAVSVHSLAFSLLLAPVLRYLSFWRRALAGVALYAALVGAIYFPIYALATRTFHVLPVAWVHDSPQLREGDALLYTGRWTRPDTWRRGDLAVFRIDPRGGGGVVVQGGFGVDRIVGLPGDHVICESGTLLVNGALPPPDEQPIRGLAALPELDIVLREGEYLVLPTSLRWYEGANARDYVRGMLASVSRVPETHLVGRVFWRVRPIGRAGPL